MYIVENVTKFHDNSLKNYCNVYPVEHCADDYETIVTPSPIPLMNCKLALSVLPFKQTSHKPSMETLTNSKVKHKESDISVKEYLESTSINKSPSSDFCEVKKSSELKESYLKEIKFDILDNNYVKDIREARTLKEPFSGFFDAEELRLKSIDDNIEMIKDVNCDNNSHMSNYILQDTPSWLPFLSPNLSHTKTSTVEEVNSQNDDHSTRIAQRASLKGKSFKELLHYAEQVEKSFSQKAQQIESLENILHEELDSLEKDLQTVHDIHQNLNSSISAIDVRLTNKQEIDTATNDLIDFSENIIDLNPEEPRMEFYPPKFITHLQNKVVQRGSRARLYCSITGDPSPDVVWLKNGKLLKEKSRYIFNDLMEFGFYVDIYNVKSTDSGNYVCLATNSCGSAQTEAYLKVIGEREDSPEEPKFLDCPDDLTITEGEKVSFEWKIAGTPVPHVIWFKNAEKIETSLRTDVFSNHKGTCRLTIQNVDERDSAIYSCYLENGIGSAVSTVLLSVKESKSLFRDTEPKEFSFEKSSLCSSSGESETSCAELPKSKNPTDQVISNIPGPPCAPSIFSVGRTWVMLSWTPPLSHLAKKSCLTYLIESRLLNSSHWKEVGKTRNTIYTAHGFKSKRSYAFRISAGNSCGWGRPAILSQPVHFTSR